MAMAAWRLSQFVVIDFEATCDKDKRIYPQEIIEFPAILVDAAGRALSEFRTYVRPRHHPVLTAYCTDLTGIRQDQVDAGVDLQEALAMLDAWLRAAAGAGNFAVVTWGDWDCRTLDSECRFKGLAKPPYFDRWVNLKVHFAAAFGGGPQRRRSLPEAVQEAGLPWCGRWHCGLDDARNTARLLAELVRRGVTVSITGWIAPPPPPHAAAAAAELQQRPPPVAGGDLMMSPSNNNPASSSAAPAVCFCYCGVVSRSGVIATPGSMQGRRFHGCGNWTPEFGAMCRFFLWMT